MKQISNPIVWLMLAFSLYFLGTGSVGLLGPDEPRYADVARGMMTSGDYITPRLFGAPWFEKPPLYYWLAAQSLRTGASEIGARLPSALAACLSVLFLFFMARDAFGVRTAAIASIVLGSTAGWIGFAHAATMDMLFSSAFCAAMLFLGNWFWRKNGMHLYWFFALLGLATLAKGPVAVVLAGGVALAYIALFREWNAIPKLLLSPGTIVWAVVALPWYALCYKANGYVFIDEFIVKHNFGRFVSNELGHGQPLWYFVPVLVAGMFPWSLLLVLPAMDLFRTGLDSVRESRRKAYLFLWFAVTFVFFSLSQNKLPGYILPTLPPLALWIASIIEGGETAKGQPSGAYDESNALQRLSLWLIGSAALLLLTVPLVAPVLPGAVIEGVRRSMAELVGHYWRAVVHGAVPLAPMLMVLVPVGMAIYKLIRRDLVEAAFFTMIGMALSLAMLVEFMAPEINRVASVRSVAQRMQALGIDGSEVAVSGLDRSQSLGLGFYLSRELPEWNERTSPAEIAYVIAKDDRKITDARSMSLFPGQRLRLWALPRTQFQIQIDRPDGKEQ